MMRRILLDHAKSHKASKRGSGIPAESLDEPLLIAEKSAQELIALDDALAELAKVDPQRSEIVELRYFGGLSNEESAQVLGISPATVQRQWTGAKAWLYNQLSERKDA
jgi:RNA polymerase sigma factor (TIGR02999 family)